MSSAEEILEALLARINQRVADPASAVRNDVFPAQVKYARTEKGKFIVIGYTHQIVPGLFELRRNVDPLSAAIDADDDEDLVLSLLLDIEEPPPLWLCVSSSEGVLRWGDEIEDPSKELP